MKTSNFANNQRHKLKGISISRYPATRQSFSGPEFPPLMPSEQLLSAYKNGKISWSKYRLEYDLQLNCLSPEWTWDRLNKTAQEIGASEPILLCHESAKTLDSAPCHRRLVAKWFERSLEIPAGSIPEWSKNLEPQRLQQDSGEQARRTQSNHRFYPGQEVTGVPGRASHGWYGRVERIDSNGYVWVWWRERAEHESKIVARNPVTGAWPENLQLAMHRASADAS